MPRYKILTLDGGGSWAIIEVLALMQIFDPKQPGHQILSQFDMVAANSGGSIVLGGLVENLTLTDIFNFFNSLQKRQSVFVANHPHIPAFPVEKYSAEAKLKGLQTAFPTCGNRPLAGITDAVIGPSGKPVHLLISTFDYDRNRGVFFRSAPAPTDPKGRHGWGIGDPTTATLAECIHASSNAPVVYFDRPAELPTQPGKRYWDGGLAGTNNPCLIAVSEALVLGQNPREIAVLSIGTGSTFLPLAQKPEQNPPIYQQLTAPGLFHDIQKVTGAILDDPPDVATFMAHVMSGGPPENLAAPADSSIVRMNPMIAPIIDSAKVYGIPPGLTPQAFQNLINLGLDAVQQQDVDEITSFAKLWIDGTVPNQPVRMDSDYRIEIGQGTFAEAKQAWSLLSAS